MSRDRALLLHNVIELMAEDFHRLTGYRANIVLMHPNDYWTFCVARMASLHKEDYPMLGAARVITDPYTNEGAPQVALSNERMGDELRKVAEEVK